MTQHTAQHKKDDRPARFALALKGLERGELASLRRGLGGDERSVYWLERLYVRSGYGAARPWERDALQLVAGLYALRPARDDGRAGEEEAEADEQAAPEQATRRAITIGTLMGRLHRQQNLEAGRSPDEGSSTEKRFLALLDADRGGLEYHMRQAVALLHARQEVPDWEQLAHDLLTWGDGTRRRWAQDFYRETSHVRETKTDEAAPDGQATPTSDAPLFDLPAAGEEGDETL